MVILIEEIFINELKRCPESFQSAFRKSYQQLKAVDSPTELKGVVQLEKKLYKLTIGKSRIALRAQGNTLIIGCFLYNQFYTSPE